MNFKLTFITLLMLLSFQMMDAKGGIPILYSSGDDIIKVLDLPNNDEYMIQDDFGKWHHADLGIKHNQFSIFWIPIINYGDEEYVLYTEDVSGYDYLYADLSRDDIEYLQSLYGGIPSKPELPFWDAWGGKIVILLIIGGFIFIKSL